MLLLVLANAGYAAWSAGLLAPYGFAPAPSSEPQRLQQQIRPESLRIIAPPESRPAAAAEPGDSSAAGSGTLAVLPAFAVSPLVAVAALATAPAECLQAGSFTEEQTVALRARLQSVLPPDSWLLESAAAPPRWLIYMGKYASAEALVKKRSELRQLRVPAEPLNHPALEPGLSLGDFASATEADAELVSIAKRGVHSAKVIQAPAQPGGQKLRLPAVSPALRQQLELLTPQLAGKALQACA